MKRYIISIFLLLIFTTTFIFANNKKLLTGKDVLKKSIQISSPETMYSVNKEEVYFANGKKRTFLIKSWMKDKNKTILFKYVKPARVKGDKFLFLKNGEIWAYFSKTGRIRRIASSAKKSKMQGSDFSYEDISMLSSMDKDYKVKILKEKKFNKKNCYLLELIPLKKDISYNKLIAYIDKDNYLLYKIDFYKNNKLIKSLLQKDYKKNGDFYIPLTTIMKSKNNSKTIMKTVKYKININLPDSLFNKNNLGK